MGTLVGISMYLIMFMEDMVKVTEMCRRNVAVLSGKRIMCQIHGLRQGKR